MSSRKIRPLFNTTHIIVYGFAAVILIGTLILMLPISSASGQWTNPIDALFTTTTAVCVTGLVVVPTYSYWSLFGKIVIFCMIQLGGLGVICITMGLFILLRKKITIKERKLIQESYNLEQSGGMVKTVIKVFKTTFIIEGIGAVLYSVRFIPQYGFVKGVCFSIFHAVSAFCNAGIDILGPSSLEPYNNDWYFMIVTMFLIISGGLGFIVWWEIVDLIKQIRNKELASNKFIERLTLHSKIALFATIMLLISGAVILFVLEYSNPATFGNMKLSHKILSACFESVTLRTAGFAGVSQAGFNNNSLMLMCVFMLIGGSPMGTAGGIKTTTVAILLIEVFSAVKGKKHTEIFHRRLNRENIRNAISVTAISLFVAVTAIVALTYTENIQFKKMIFEAFSAIGTVGLSMDITSSLSSAGRLIITVLMFAGRIGPITLVMAFTSNVSEALDRDYPERKILIG
ncbi:MAG: TrkH family potassium uptake protein [Lachnospiraceae bacterium]|nr:TrkH family potassium uptake protein [Lachnospiraceae bacterium]